MLWVLSKKDVQTQKLCSKGFTNRIINRKENDFWFFIFSGDDGEQGLRLIEEAAVDLSGIVNFGAAKAHKLSKFAVEAGVKMTPHYHLYYNNGDKGYYGDRNRLAITSAACSIIPADIHQVDHEFDDAFQEENWVLYCNYDPWPSTICNCIYFLLRDYNITFYYTNDPILMDFYGAISNPSLIIHKNNITKQISQFRFLSEYRLQLCNFFGIKDQLYIDPSVLSKNKSLKLTDLDNCHNEDFNNEQAKDNKKQSEAVSNSKKLNSQKKSISTNLKIFTLDHFKEECQGNDQRDICIIYTKAEDSISSLAKAHSKDRVKFLFGDDDFPFSFMKPNQIWAYHPRRNGLLKIDEDADVDFTIQNILDGNARFQKPESLVEL